MGAEAAGARTADVEAVGITNGATGRVSWFKKKKKNGFALESFLLLEIGVMDQTSW